MPATRWRVPSSREERMRRFASSLQRWATFSPARCTTASRPSSAAAGAGSASGCHATAPGEEGVRDSVATSSPRARSRSTSRAPISPLAPVTVTLIRGVRARGGPVSPPDRPGSTMPQRPGGLHHGCHMPIITIQNLTKDFGAVRAVDDLTFDIDEGKVVGFLGPNGSGKTTTLRALVGLVTPTSGTATIHGVPYAELADPLSQIGVMLEAASHPARTARNHLRVLAVEAGVPRSRADEMLELVDLGGAARRRSGGFSLGMTQRLGLAAALLGDPQILVLDEPANGLDPEGIRWLRDFLRGVAAEGRTVLLSSHVLSEVAQTVDEVVVINHGRLIAHSTLAGLSAGAGPRVRVRSPQSERLSAVLAEHGHDAARDGAGSLVVVGSTQEAIGQLAFDHGVVLYEIAPESSNLEDVFFDLTSTPHLEVVASRSPSSDP